MRFCWSTAICSFLVWLRSSAVYATPVQHILKTDVPLPDAAHQDRLHLAQQVPFYPPLSFSTAWDLQGGGRGEPLNVIISGLSHPFVLSKAGLLRYVKTLGFEPECLSLHFGPRQTAHLADGNDWQSQDMELRQAYFPVFGTCLQSAFGGNHFRAWKQNGTLANSGAWFLALSVERDFKRHHDIKPNGYDQGRDLFTRSAEENHRHYVTKVEYLNLIRPGRRFNHGIPTDGDVALVTVDLY